MTICATCKSYCCREFIAKGDAEFTEEIKAQIRKEASMVVVMDTPERFEYRCEHLDGIICKIYPNRPEGCKEFEIDGAECKLRRKRWEP
jgi:Fe-S-cluster containining protein